MNLDKFRQILGEAGYSDDMIDHLWLCKPDFIPTEAVDEEKVRESIRFMKWSLNKGVRIDPPGISDKARPLTLEELEQYRPLLEKLYKEFENEQDKMS